MHNYKINVIVNASTGTVHAVTPSNLEPSSTGSYLVACQRLVPRGTHHVREQDMVTCASCRSLPLHLPQYREGVEAPSDDPYCAQHGHRFPAATGCPECTLEA